MVTGYDIPERWRAREFDFMGEDDLSSAQFFRYRGWWYYLGEFERTDIVPGYDGFSADTAFSGVAVKLNREGDSVQVARVY